MTMVSRGDKEPLAAFYMLPFLLGFAAGELLGGFLAGFTIAQFRKWGGAFGYGIDGHRAGTYDIASGRGFLKR